MFAPKEDRSDPVLADDSVPRWACNIPALSVIGKQANQTVGIAYPNGTRAKRSTWSTGTLARKVAPAEETM